MKIFVNLLTTLRFLLTIVLMIQFEQISKVKFIIYIIILFLTDYIDGKLARKFKVQTIYGSNMDAIADKTLSIGLMFLMIKTIPIIWLPLIGELVIAIINISGKLMGKKIESIIEGKIKTWVIAITIILSYCYYYQLISYIPIWIGSIITFIFQIYVIIQYIKKIHSQKRILKNKQSDIKNFLYHLFSTEYYLNNK